MREFGTHRQPKGTWSDDGALILCTVDSLVNCEFDTTDMGERFVRWQDEALWTATGKVFDIGSATSDALSRIAFGTPAELAGGRREDCNGNGALMRIIPMVIRFADDPLESFVSHIDRASAITHGHARSRMACVFYGLIVVRLLSGVNPQTALDIARGEFVSLYETSPEFAHFRPLLESNFASMRQDRIASTGYVLHTLHASIWCLLTTSSFRECVLKAVNLGDDTDTTGCVSGGLAGVAYGIKAIQSDWLDALARGPDVKRLFEQFLALRC
jgi:ADP-ribosylglycohydrolase